MINSGIRSCSLVLWRGFLIQCAILVLNYKRSTLCKNIKHFQHDASKINNRQTFLQPYWNTRKNNFLFTIYNHYVSNIKNIGPILVNDMQTPPLPPWKWSIFFTQKMRNVLERMHKQFSDFFKYFCMKNFSF